MPALLVLLALAGAGIDGEGARRHAAALSALGPHPWGSPRVQAAAQYVAAQFRSAGLGDVRLQPFRSHDIDGFNVVGVLRGPGVEWVALGAHHDTAPEAPGAYDDGGGVGVLIEVARALARRPSRPRTYVFVSWDGEEAWWTGRTTTAGSRAWLAESGLDFEQMVGAFVVEMSGFARGRPCLHPIAYADPRARGRYVIAPAWLVRTALAGGQFAVGDPRLSWLYQPAVRTLRVRLYGDDLSLLQAGRPALFAADSSFTSFYPWYHQPSDTADKIDAAALARMGSAVLGLADALARAPRGYGAQAQWFAVAGTVVDAPWLLALGLASLAPGLMATFAAGGRPLALGLVRTAAFALLLWRHPVPALWVFLVPNLLAARVGWRLMTLAFLPALALVGLGLAAVARGFVGGLWLGPLDLALAAVVAVLLWRPRPGRRPPRAKRR